MRFCYRLFVTVSLFVYVAVYCINITNYNRTTAEHVNTLLKLQTTRALPFFNTRQGRFVLKLRVFNRSLAQAKDRSYSTQTDCITTRH